MITISDETEASMATAAELAECARIRRTMQHHDGDAEDLISYAKEVLRLRAALSVALPMQEPAPPAASVAPAVKVKALEWRPHSSRSGWLVADTPPGGYFAWEQAGLGYWSHGSIVGREVHGGIDGAKAAAQADHEQRILSALTSSTASGEDGWRDISSAPKDGTEIDLWARRDGTNRYERVPDCSWQFMSDWDGREFDGWMGLRRGFSRSYVEPTHWRLPPPAPSSSKEDGNAR